VETCGRETDTQMKLMSCCRTSLGLNSGLDFIFIPLYFVLSFH